MCLVRFDEEVSLPVSRDGSRVRIGALTADDARVRVSVVHLPPRGIIGRHATTSQQMLAVIAGSGLVSGRSGEPEAIGPGYAAVWEPGEDHDARSEAGLTAVCAAGEFDVMALSVTRDIVVSDYDPAWPEWFAAVRRTVWPAVEDVALRIDHVGSTAVPGLAAKPMIDMDVVVATEHGVMAAVERLAAIGYRWRGDLGVPGRQAVEPARDDGLPAHHLYVVVEDSKAHLDHRLLRDLLREDADTRERYAALKRHNARQANRNMDVYVAAKAAFVAGLLTRARAERGFPPAAHGEPEIDGP